MSESLLTSQKGILYLASLLLIVAGEWVPWTVWRRCTLLDKTCILARSLALLAILGVAISL
mgnify:FL=1